jgi:3',5'-cyclic AMP phosphodiesterase CpdA
MTDAITLAHLSDLHLAPVRGFSLRYLNVKRGLGYLNWQRSRRRVHLADSLDAVVADMKSHAPDHIAVTGDLINLGLPAEYETARAWLEGLGGPDTVTAIPGNHDVYTRLRGHPGIERWADYMQPEAWGARFGTGPERGFPFVRRVGPAALICLCSGVETPPFVAAGELGPAQIAAFEKILQQTAEEGLVRVVLIHHPPLPGQASPRRGLRDAARLEQVLAREGAELILHGHNHRDSHIDFTWARGRIPVLGVASGSMGRAHKGEPLGRYNLLRIGRENGEVRIECTTRGLDELSGTVLQLDRKRLL